MKKTWRSPNKLKNYRDGKFVNLLFTPVMTHGISFRKILKDHINRPKSVYPSSPIPSVITNLKELYSETPAIVWFGHSSYLIHCKGTNILVDPVFSGSASPVNGMIRAYPGSNEYKAEDMPPIDFLIITHNHYDHLDKKTLAQLMPQTKTIYVPLGVGKDIPGIENQSITEMNWWETETPLPYIQLTSTPSRHFSGRGLKRNGSLWSSFVLKIYGYTIFISGDGGYGPHFKEIGAKYGPFNIAMLECGQYNKAWSNIHMMPEETVQAGIDLKAQILMPIHWAKFTLANHPWNESIQRFTQRAKELEVSVTTPRIGEIVLFDKSYPHQEWWNQH